MVEFMERFRYLGIAALINDVLLLPAPVFWKKQH
jgi:hypothetical protein